eukprot:CAMPEP_0171147908 /NCGR_PEP_ID=MMETSP0766_2-20121228/148302_1 /TAXON_ID=439317 /ORGANISM="Gambierdiscus australes, Strain CAWD 149" /LENGTH=57 /DNA_ID=CAMNT_0011611817 /DNA_START=570 /DNA_END=743 /DNA_ORIENTATION=-
MRKPVASARAAAASSQHVWVHLEVLTTQVAAALLGAFTVTAQGLHCVDAGDAHGEGE